MWDKRSQSQVLQVVPFLPRRACSASAQEMAAEMERVQVRGLLDDNTNVSRCPGVIALLILA